jgi:hypothetical protein
MSTKLNSQPYTVLSQTAVVATVTSQETNELQRDNVGYVITWANGSGTPTGTFFVQVKNQPSDPWDNLNFGVPISLAGNSGSHTINLNQLPYAATQIEYVPSAGQVDLTITIVTKKVGG